MTAKEKVCILKNITDNELLVKRINDYAMRFMREEKIYDYFFSCPIYGMDGELIDLEFRRKESGDLVYNRNKTAIRKQQHKTQRRYNSFACIQENIRRNVSTDEAVYMRVYRLLA